ncbi:hypothetical protein Q9966_003530 [Columba livia]|nr:hypothetical protein Q9966_003530 [Columba livia]
MLRRRVRHDLSWKQDNAPISDTIADLLLNLRLCRIIWTKLQWISVPVKTREQLESDMGSAGQLSAFEKVFFCEDICHKMCYFAFPDECIKSSCLLVPSCFRRSMFSALGEAYASTLCDIYG